MTDNPSYTAAMVKQASQAAIARIEADDGQRQAIEVVCDSFKRAGDLGLAPCNANEFYALTDYDGDGHQELNTVHMFLHPVDIEPFVLNVTKAFPEAAFVHHGTANIWTDIIGLTRADGEPPTPSTPPVLTKAEAERIFAARQHASPADLFMRNKALLLGEIRDLVGLSNLCLPTGRDDAGLPADVTAREFFPR